MFHIARQLFEKYKDIILYLVFGVLTTIVSFAIYYLLVEYAGVSALLSNAISWVGAVAFAFLTNKPFVFRSFDWSAGVVLPELGKFVGGRVGSGVFESAYVFVTVDLLHWNSMIMKAIASVVVVIINYVVSKIFVFKKH